MKRAKKQPPVVADAGPPPRIRPERKPIALRWSGMWRDCEQTSTWVHSIAEWHKENEPKIPPFQRGLVWESSDELLLADSIDSGFPIGTLVLWQRDYSAPTWIIDGQQRVTALMRMARGETSIFFDCDTDCYVMGSQYADDPMRYVPVALMFDWRGHMEWSRAVFNWGVDADDETNATMEDRIERADAARSRMRDFRVSLIVIHKDDEAFVREVFRRINTTGKPFTESEVFAALEKA